MGVEKEGPLKEGSVRRGPEEEVLKTGKGIRTRPQSIDLGGSPTEDSTEGKERQVEEGSQSFPGRG